MNPQNSEFLLPLVLLQEQHALLDAKLALLMAQRRGGDGIEEEPDLAECFLGFQLKEGCSLVIMDFLE